MSGSELGVKLGGMNKKWEVEVRGREQKLGVGDEVGVGDRG